jgi:hypothetical protein
MTSHVKVHNSTFFNNSATRGTGGGGIADNGADAGGAIFEVDSELEIADSTFSGNQGTGSGAAVVAYSDYDESSPFQPDKFVLQNTIIANNGADECFLRSSGHLTIVGTGNLIMNNGSGVGQRSPCPGVVAVADPQLQALQLNSPGNTPTMAIFPNSSAFNKANPGSSLSTDQRGVPRPQNGGFDIGAFEARGDGR